MCYPGNFSQALKLVAEYMLNDGNGKSYKSLKTYLNSYKRIEQSIGSMKDLPIS